MVKKSPKVPRIQLVKRASAATTKMVVKVTLEVKRKGFTKSRSSALSVKDSVILQESAMRTRRNLKEMKPGCKTRV